MKFLSYAALIALCVLMTRSRLAQANDVAAALVKVRSVGAKGEGHQGAIEALESLRNTTTKDLMAILSAMDGSNKIACNWLRSVAEAAVERGASQGQVLPVKELEAFLADRKHSPLGRRFAYELIASVDPTAESRLIPACLDDESMELRRDAVLLLLRRADELEKAGNTAELLKVTTEAYEAARQPEQVKSIAEKLGKLGKEVNVANHFGLIQNWHIIGPFDHTDNKAFDVAYPPEKEVDLTKKLTGKKGEVSWTPVVTKKQDGMVDVNEVLGKEKFAIAYAFNEFESDKDQEVELRYGCMNGSKVFVNGEQIAANEVYHTGYEVDQYRAKAKLKKGKNQILVKICQNNQTEQWAQDWTFLLRVCDSLGTAIHSLNRPEVKMEAPPPPPMPNPN